MRRSSPVWILCLVIVAAVLATVAAAQNDRARPAAQAPDDPLVAEIRALRADLNRALSAGVRAQLLVGRLQLQEQRINSSNDRLAEIRKMRSAKESEQGGAARVVEQLENAIRGGNRAAEEQRALEFEAGELKIRAALLRAEVQELRAQESSLAGDFTAEQGRWIYLNDRLDDIERSLTETAR